MKNTGMMINRTATVIRLGRPVGHRSMMPCWKHPVAFP